MSVLRGVLSPNRSKVCSCSTRSIFTWQLRSSSPISSRKMVPLSAISKRPARSFTAPVKAPFLCPNISLSNSDCEIPPKFTFTNGFPRRGLLRCIASAISSLPVPLSPVMSTEALVWAMRFATSSTLSSPSLRPMMWLRSNSPSSAFVVLSEVFPAVSSSAVSMRCISATLFHGLVTKSNAPACIPFTASWMLPHAVIRMTGTCGQKSFT